jgi:hypothetical protein
MTQQETAGYMVVFEDDSQGLCLQFGPSGDCEGAIEGCDAGDTPLLFATRAEARQAIRITLRYHALLKAQNKPYDSLFCGDSRECLKITRVVYYVQQGGDA